MCVCTLQQYSTVRYTHTGKAVIGIDRRPTGVRGGVLITPVVICDYMSIKYHCPLPCPHRLLLGTHTVLSTAHLYFNCFFTPGRPPGEGGSKTPCLTLSSRDSSLKERDAYSWY